MTAERDAYNCSAKFITRDAGYGPVNRFMQLCEELSGFQLSGIYAEIRIDHPTTRQFAGAGPQIPSYARNPTCLNPFISPASSAARVSWCLWSAICQIPGRNPG
jgi:hypothetical protein